MDTAKPKTLTQVGEQLAKPFPEEEIRWRAQSSYLDNRGTPVVKAVPYIDARQVHQRLDDCVGMARWNVSYDIIPLKNNDVIFVAKVGILFSDGWVVKEDGAEGTDIEAIKGGFSDAFKRACVTWGIGRYLYAPVVRYGIIDRDGEHSTPVKDKTSGRTVWAKWNAPELFPKEQ